MTQTPVSGEPARERRTMTAHELSMLYLCAAVATWTLSMGACALGRHLLWNWTPSLPLGLYWLHRGERPARGDLVAFPVPVAVEALVHERRYLPPGALLIKTLVAGEGDEVCADTGILTVNGRPLAGGGHVLMQDSAGRALPRYEGCGDLPDGWVFLASPHERSFDSRTFGPVRRDDLRGRVTPLWTY